MIREKAIDVEIKVEFPRMIVCGPQMKVNRVVDTVYGMVSDGMIDRGSHELINI